MYIYICIQYIYTSKYACTYIYICIYFVAYMYTSSCMIYGIYLLPFVSSMIFGEAIAAMGLAEGSLIQESG